MPAAPGSAGAAAPADGLPAPSPAGDQRPDSRVSDPATQGSAGERPAGVPTPATLALPSPDTKPAPEAAAADPVPPVPAGDSRRAGLPAGPVVGKVIDGDSGRPVPGAAIAAGGRVVTSTALGEFELAELPAGSAATVLAGGYERATLDAARGPTSTVALKRWAARGVYASLFALADPGVKRGIDRTLTGTRLNAIVIDVKGDRAWTLFPSQDPTAKAIGAEEAVPLPNVAEVVRDYHKNGIYVIGRIVVFKDDLMARNGSKVGRDVAVKKPDGSLWLDKAGYGWVDPTRPEGWEYPITLAKEAAAKGFDEIQFDYIRFPTDSSPGNSLNAATFSKPNTEEVRVGSIIGFLKKANEALQPLGVAISIDTFGYTTWRTDDTGIGQDLARIADYVDYISPMVYPSTYSSGLPTDPPIDFPEVVYYPYEVVFSSVKRAVDRFDGKRAKVRPWLQYYDDGATPFEVPYGPREIRAQVQASVDAGGQGWLYWDPFNEYEHGAVIVDELPAPRIAVSPTPSPG